VAREAAGVELAPDVAAVEKVCCAVAEGLGMAPWPGGVERSWSVLVRMSSGGSERSRSA
jgi:hypothetical protein